jgi:hypothetical protein
MSMPNSPTTAPTRPPWRYIKLNEAAPVEGVAEAEATPVLTIPLSDALMVPVICVTLAVVALAALLDVALPFPLWLALPLALPVALA